MRKWRTGLRSVVSKLEEILESYESFIVGRTSKDKKQTYLDDLPVKKPERGTREWLDQGLTPKTRLYRIRMEIKEVDELIQNTTTGEEKGEGLVLKPILEKHRNELKRKEQLEQSRFLGTCKRHMDKYLKHLEEDYDELKGSVTTETEDLIRFMNKKVYPHYLETRKERRKGETMECQDEILDHRKMVLHILRTIEDYMEDHESIPRGDFSPKEPTPYHLVHGNKSESKLTWERVTPRKSDS